jgi:osmotically-inducible protein OsmY
MGILRQTDARHSPASLGGTAFPGSSPRTFLRLSGLAVLVLSWVAILTAGSPALAEGGEAPSAQTQTAPAQSPTEPPAEAAPGETGTRPTPPAPEPLPSDDEIRSLLEAALARDPVISEHGSLQVKCEEGIVTLSGRAETLSVLLQAERRAGEIRGVLDVVTVAGLATSGISDSQILLEIQRALDVPAFHGDSVAVAVTEGRVHLNGTSVTYARKLLAERSATEVQGVVSVQNNLRVVAPPEGNDAELARRIRLLLTGGMTPVPGSFEVTVRDRIALLHGKVPLYAHRIQAERLALSVGGVVSVENRLKVDPTLLIPGFKEQTSP